MKLHTDVKHNETMCHKAHLDTVILKNHNSALFIFGVISLSLLIVFTDILNPFRGEAHLFFRLKTILVFHAFAVVC